jgi:hypothetical protein
MTSDAKNKFNYFENLEIIIKKGSAAYLLILITGMAMVLINPATIFSLTNNHLFEVFVSACLFLVGGFIGLYYLVAHFGWLGELHIRMDKMFLGFLIRSNDVIYQTLLSALPPEDQAAAAAFSGKIKEKLAQSIFTKVSNDNKLFDLLLRSDIFRFWMRYWIFLYGIFTFTLLTIVSFVAVILRAGMYDKEFFIISWCFAALHIGLSIVMGKYLIRMTVSTVGQIVVAHKETISQIIHVYLPGASFENVAEEEDASYEDL